jgi:hypothetical protein
MSLDITACVVRHISYDNGKTLIQDDEIVFSGNITHNLNKMAMEAGIYKAVWRPYEIDLDFDKNKEDDYDYINYFENNTIVKAKDVSDVIKKGLEDMIKRPKHYQKFNSQNGWGLYKNFIPFLQEYLKVLGKYPEARIKCNR